MLFPDKFVYIARHEADDWAEGLLPFAEKRLTETAARLATISNYYGVGEHNLAVFASLAKRTRKTAAGLVQFLEPTPQITQLDYLGNENGQEYYVNYIVEQMTEREDVKRMLGILVVTHMRTSAELWHAVNPKYWGNRFGQGETWLAMPLRQGEKERQTIALSHEKDFDQWIRNEPEESAGKTGRFRLI